MKVETPKTLRRVALLAAMTLIGCMRLDAFLFSPEKAPASMDMMALATDIPSGQRSEIFIEASDGTPVNAYFVSHQPGDGTDPNRHHTGILYCHGNARNIALYAARVQALWNLGYSVLVFDYRGFGKTPGVPTEAGVYLDAEAARQYLESQTGFEPQRVALYGYSLGGAICTHLAVQQPTPALLIESTFASVQELITDNEDLSVPRAWYADARMNTRGIIPQHTGALLLMHGQADTYLTVKYGQEIAAAAAGHANPLQSWFVPWASHDTVPCLNRRGQGEVSGQCQGGFDPEYLGRVAGLIDGAIPPAP